MSTVAELLAKVDAAQNTAELDALRMPIVKAMHDIGAQDGAQEAFDKLQGAFIKAQFRLTMVDHPGGRAILADLKKAGAEAASLREALQRLLGCINTGRELHIGDFTAYEGRFPKALVLGIGDRLNETTSGKALLDRIAALEEQVERLTKERDSLVEGNKESAEIRRVLRELGRRSMNLLRFHAGRCPLDPIHNYSGSEEHLSEYRHLIAEWSKQMPESLNKEAGTGG